MKESKFKTPEDVFRFLDLIPQFGSSGTGAIDMSLDRVRHFCEAAGNPQNRFKAVHVAGTNGKGTVCKMLASVCQEAGYKTGLYTSPHLLKYNERIRINAIEVPDEKILQFFQNYENELETIRLTYFEIGTCLAFWYFADQNVDIAIIETGLGGRLDATNIVTPEVSVITSISMDHANILGDTISLIASEKAGIIKPGRPVVIGNLPDDAEGLITKTAKKTGSEIIKSMKLRPEFTYQNMIRLQMGNQQVRINATDRKQIDAVNAAICYSVTDLLQKQLNISETDFIRAIEKIDCYYPIHAHFQKLHPDLDWYFDGAHNIEALSTLSVQLHKIAPVDQWTIFLSLMKDKVSLELLNHFQNAGKIYYYPLNVERAANYSDIEKILNRAENPGDKNEILNLLHTLKTELVIFTGSFYFYETVWHWMGTIASSID
ncbi:MAG TPA: folylpolyglutamate synthase/dihydrofolate synthase family protein [Balneolaceae bacterium]|nr:folylpolyglutamate synthase/dihydrofolate synthase family protein [Balneolaceae bacterium]